jgi:glycosyltransferase involved in cell wall biosynthesis
MADTKVFLIQQGLLNYRIPFFNALAQREGIDFALVACPISSRLRSEAFREADQQSRFKSFLLPILSEKPFQYLCALVALLVRERPDVVITGLGHRVLYTLSILKHLFRFKLVLWNGGVPHRDKTKVLEYARKIDAKKLGFPTFRTFLKHCDGFVLYSNNAKSFFREYFSIPEEKMFVAPNSPDTNLYWKIREHMAENGSGTEIKQRYSPNGEKILLTLGRLNKERRLDLLLKAYRKISGEYPDVPFVIIGDGPERTPMEKLSCDMGLKNVFFTGEIYDDTELAKYFAYAYAYAGIASLAVKIAMTMGVPVVGFDYGLEVHAVRDGVTGFVVPFGDWEMLADKILFLLKNEETRNSFGRAAESIVQEEINLDMMVKGFTDAIRNCKNYSRLPDRESAAKRVIE